MKHRIRHLGLDAQTENLSTLKIITLHRYELQYLCLLLLDARNSHDRAPITYEHENNAVFALIFNDLIYLIRNIN